MKPTHAYLVATKVASGCLNGQSLVADVTSKLLQSQPAGAVMEQKAGEDFEDARELYLAFPAARLAKLAKLSGYLVAKISVQPSAAGEPARFVLNDASILESDGRLAIQLAGSGTATVTVKLLYSTRPELAKAWFSCPEAGAREPYPLSFIPAYAPEGVDEASRSFTARGRSTFSVPVTESVLSALAPLEKAVAALNAITQRFRTAESPFVLKGEGLTPQALRSVASSAAGAGHRAQAALIPDSRGPSQAPGASFDPTLRQKVAIRQSNGRLVGAELRIRVERSL